MNAGVERMLIDPGTYTYVGDADGVYDVEIVDYHRKGFTLMSIVRPEGGWKITRPPVHPGEVLREEFMQPLGLSINRLALDLHVPVTRISEIVNERRGVTADTALRLSRYFGNTPHFWLNLQQSFELITAQQKTARTIAKQVRPRSAA